MLLLIIKIVLSLIAAYLIGSIPTAFIFAKFLKGLDIRKAGSGNVGATNAFRVLGKLPGILVLVIDIIKGLICTTLIADFLPVAWINIWRIVLGVVVVVGHNWTIFLNFKGGKGMATSLGVLIGLAIKISGIRIVLALSVGVWLFLFYYLVLFRLLQL
jgi:Predicted membrane protein